MKKLLLSIFALGSIYSASAQTAPLVNGDFEATITANSSFPNYSSTQGWGGGIYKSETAAPGQLLQSVKLESVYDAALNSAFGGAFASDTLPGFIQQSVDGNTAAYIGGVMSFKYKNITSAADTAIIFVEVYDTLAAGFNDDVLLAQGVFATSDAAATWTDATISIDADPAATGTANQLFIIATSSYGGLTGSSTPVLGNAFYLDDLKLSLAGVKENAASTVKVYPNPANDVLNIKVDGEISNVTITTLDGKVVSSTATSTVNVASLTAGLYIYQVTANGKVSTGNFVKN